MRSNCSINAGSSINRPRWIVCVDAPACSKAWASSASQLVPAVRMIRVWGRIKGIITEPPATMIEPMDQPPPQHDPWKPAQMLPPPPPAHAPPVSPTPASQRPPLEPLPPNGRVRVAFAWVSIGVFTLLTIMVQYQALDLPPLNDEQLLRPSLQIKIQGQVAVGADQMSTGPGAAANADQSMANIAAVIQTPADQVRYAIVYAEVGGAEDARWVIADLRQNPARFDLTDAELADLAILDRVYQGQTISSADRQRLLDRHDWFGELAISYNASQSSPDYKSPRSSGQRLIVFAIFLILVALLVGAGALGVCIFAITQLAGGKVRPSFNAFPDATNTPILSETIAVFLAIFATTGMLAVYLIKEHKTDITILTLPPLTLCPLIPLLFGGGWRRYQHLTGLHRGAGVFKEIGCGLLGYLAGLPLIVIGFVISFVLFLLFPIEAEHPVVDPVGGLGPLGILLLVLMLTVWAPLVEETLFRGLFYSHCRRWMAWPVAGIVTGVVFAAIHPQWIWFVPGLASVGFVFAMVREWRGSLIGPIAAHALHNGSIACILVIALWLMS